MDGMMSMRSDGLIALPDAILNHEGRLSAAEQAMRDRPSHEKLNVMFNDLRRDLISKVDASEAHTRDMLEGLKSEMNERVTTLQLQLTQAFNSMAESAAEKAVEKQRLAEKKARDEIESKAKDAVRGLRLVFIGVGPLVGGALAIVALFGIKQMTGWSLF